MRPRSADRAGADAGRLALVGVGCGVGGGMVMAAPLVIYDWANATHSALELPMAVTAWLFGLDHYVRNGYHWWPIVIGALLLLVYWSVLGVVYAAVAERVYRVRTWLGSVALGGFWSFASFMLFWYMLLPIARDGAPFRATVAAPAMFVAPNWVWILAFTLSGVVTGLCCRALSAPVAADTTGPAGQAVRPQAA